MKKLLMIVFSSASFVLYQGCAPGLITINPNQPASFSEEQQGPVVVIQSVTDTRIFEERPSRPSIPSLGPEAAMKPQEEIKKIAVGRVRNGHGKALGNIILQENSTVEGVMRENLSSALAESGFTVVENTDFIPEDAIVIDVVIEQLWAWATPGWKITVECQILTEIKSSKTNDPIVVDLTVSNRHNSVHKNARPWKAIVDKALEEYRSVVSTKVAQQLKQ